jgi:hypothetical protein
MRRATIVTRREQYRRVARDCRLMVLEMAEEWDRLAGQQEHAAKKK